MTLSTENAIQGSKNMQTIQRELDQAIAVLSARDNASDTALCDSALDQLLDTAPYLSDLDAHRADDYLPLSGQTIAQAIDAYRKGNRSSIRIAVTYARNDANGNDHYQAKFTFIGTERTVTAVITVVEEQDLNSHNLELAAGSGAHWVHIKGEPVETAERDALRDMLAPVAFEAQTGEFVFISAPDEDSLQRAELTLTRYTPVIEAIISLPPVS